ncbi:hypothetical protein C2G38_2045398 [Gigaspora rosea]|uniref:Uncharacterized protein n=1 Tax=Gigaspora rosea TaxID=44941 RepID=A0A397UDB2_9GLOM|nr:hypothetical protein C2G38_2045398 [Gigaspora rosea]CAG8520258.1 5736_t:CDS:1 [Gigaspora rosea]
MKLQMTTAETPSFHYLLLFREDYREEIAEHLKASPTVDDVFGFALLNKFTLAEYRVQPTKIDLENGQGTVDIEVDFEEPWNQTKANNWWLAKDLLFYLYENFENYKFM